MIYLFFFYKRKLQSLIEWEGKYWDKILNGLSNICIEEVLNSCFFLYFVCNRLNIKRYIMNNTILDMCQALLIFKKQTISFFIKSYEPTCCTLLHVSNLATSTPKWNSYHVSQRLLAKCIKLYSWNQMYESSQMSGITQFMKLYGQIQYSDGL